MNEEMKIYIYGINQKINDLEESLYTVIYRLNDIEDALKSITKDSLYEKFNNCWDLIKERDDVLTENRIKLQNMVNEFKGVISMTRAEFNRKKNEN